MNVNGPSANEHAHVLTRLCLESIQLLPALIPRHRSVLAAYGSRNSQSDFIVFLKSEAKARLCYSEQWQVWTLVDLGLRLVPMEGREEEGKQREQRSSLPQEFWFGTCGCHTISTEHPILSNVGYEKNMCTSVLSFGCLKGQGYQRLRRALLRCQV